MPIENPGISLGVYVASFSHRPTIASKGRQELGGIAKLCATLKIYRWFGFFLPHTLAAPYANVRTIEEYR